MDIYNFGSVNIDSVYRVPHLVRSGETIKASSHVMTLGGKGANQSVAVARSGACCHHIGVIGKGDSWVKDALLGYGVDLSLCSFFDGDTGTAIIEVDDSGENSIIIIPGGNGMVTHEFVDSALSNVSPGDFLILQNETSSVDYIISSAYEKGMRIFFNPAPFTPEVLSYPLDKCHLICVNESEAMMLTKAKGKELLVDALIDDMPSERVLLTLGGDGAVYLSKDKVAFSDAFSVKAVDTTGAGDTFFGYFVSSHSLGLPIEECMRRASAAAAIAVTRHGAATSIPFSSEVDLFLQSKLRKQ